LGAGAGFEPVIAFLQACVEFVISEFGKSADTHLRTQKLKDLREVIESWPKLSPELRTACLAVTRSAGVR
jgi:hypothetical protein